MAHENLTTNLGTILQKSYEVSKIGPQVTRPVKAQAQNALFTTIKRIDQLCGFQTYWHCCSRDTDPRTCPTKNRGVKSHNAITIERSD